MAAGCPCKAMDQPNHCFKLVHRPGCCSMSSQSSFSLPSDDEQGSDLSQPASRQSLQDSTPTPPPPPPTALMEDDEAAMDLELLLTGTKNEQNLNEYLGVAAVFDCYSPQQVQMEDQFDSVNFNDDEAAANEFDINDYIDPSMLGCFLPSGSSGHGTRGPRRRTSSERDPMFFERCVSREYTGRKNNCRWNVEEVERLVEGVSKFGARQWTEIKNNFFKTSIRTAVNLKDKWRNLLKAYLKNSQQTSLLHLEPSLVERIRKLAAKEPYANKRHR